MTRSTLARWAGVAISVVALWLVLQGIDLDVDKGDFVAFMGPSGSGKTTLLNLLGGLDVPSRGSITVAGDEITHLSRPKLTKWRARHVGFIFQMYNLIPVLSAFRNVELPLLLAPLSSAERKRQVVVDPGRHFLNHAGAHHQLLADDIGVARRLRRHGQGGASGTSHERRAPDADDRRVGQ